MLVCLSDYYTLVIIANLLCRQLKFQTCYSQNNIFKSKKDKLLVYLRNCFWQGTLVKEKKRSNWYILTTAVILFGFLRQIVSFLKDPSPSFLFCLYFQDVFSKMLKKRCIEGLDFGILHVTKFPRKILNMTGTEMRPQWIK